MKCAQRACAVPAGCVAQLRGARTTPAPLALVAGHGRCEASVHQWPHVPAPARAAYGGSVVPHLRVSAGSAPLLRAPVRGVRLCARAFGIVGRERARPNTTAKARRHADVQERQRRVFGRRRSPPAAEPAEDAWIAFCQRFATQVHPRSLPLTPPSGSPRRLRAGAVRPVPSGGRRQRRRRKNRRRRRRRWKSSARRSGRPGKRTLHNRYVYACVWWQRSRAPRLRAQLLAWWPWSRRHRDYRLVPAEDA